MAENILGKLRRSAVVMTYGPGSIVDFRADGAAVSAVTAGLEEWDQSFPQAGCLNPQKIHEPRLQRKLGVRCFRLPPVVDEEWRDENNNPDRRALVAVRFPDWLQCPACDRIGPSRSWGHDPGRTYRYCTSCTAQSPGGQKVFTVPVRFVMACEAGHLDDFPWHTWVGHREGCQNRRHLLLKSERPGLAGLIVSCPGCGARRSMDGVFSADTWQGCTCRGRRPWLADPDQPCTQRPRAVQRGASNLYFPVIESSLSIPPWSDRLQEALGTYWHPIVNTKAEDRPTFIRILAAGDLQPVLDELRISPEELARRVEERIATYSDEAILNIRQEEYRQFTSGTDNLAADDREFEVRKVRIPEALQPYFSHIVRVLRLREVRAIRGFTRINPPAADDDPRMASLSAEPKGWLPAVEVRGEGIFLGLNQDALLSWEKQPEVQARAGRIDEAWLAEWHSRFGNTEPNRRITPRFLMIHTFAHALMQQLTLDCGYSGASLRERLYVSEEEQGGMAGVLIYTATSDSDGTLGGLQRQGEAGRIARTLPAAVRAMEWCSTDPLCIHGAAAAPESLSGAACHACVLAPETACEEFNRFLDRAMLVGLPEHPAMGFLSPLLTTT